jgi:polysaccharide pyruvyl transferase CsaB
MDYKKPVHSSQQKLVAEKKIIVMGYYGHNNAGDEAILSVILDNLHRKYGFNSVTVLSANPTSTASLHAVKSIYNFVPSGRLDHFKKYFGRNRAQYRNTIETIKAADVLLVGGGGLFFDLENSNANLLNVLGRINWLRDYFKKNIIVFGVGIGPLRHHNSRAYARKVLDKVNAIIVRDQKSYDLLYDLDIKKPNIFLKDDIVYLLEQSRAEDTNKVLESENIIIDNNTVGIALCGYHIKQKQYFDKILALCRHILNEKHKNILFIPMATGYEDDRIGLKHLMGQLKGNVALLSNDYTPKQKLDVISRLSCIIGERLHSVIMAITVSTPVFGISYMPKVYAVFSKLDELGNQVLLPETSVTDLIKKIDFWWLRQSEQIEKLKPVVTDLKNEAIESFDILFDQIER